MHTTRGQFLRNAAVLPAGAAPDVTAASVFPQQDCRIDRKRALGWNPGCQ
jgi:hypothetical protein